MMPRETLATLVSDLIQAESPDPPGDERMISEVVERSLRCFGLEPEICEFAPGRINIITRLRGEGERSGLIFSAHMDTLPAGSGAWTHPPFAGVIDANSIHGRGACDMKSGLAAMIAAAAALIEAGHRLKGDLVLAFTGGESSNCLGARYLAETRALEGCCAILVSEPSSMQLLTAEKAALWLRVTAHGTAGHLSAGGQDDGNAVLRMLDTLPKMQNALPSGTHPLLGEASLTIGLIEGGTAINLTPDQCTAEIDIRPLPGQDPDMIEDRLADLLGDGFSIERLDFKPGVDTDIDHPFVQTCVSVATSVSKNELRPPGGASYFTDACVLSPAFNLPMVIIGPGRLGGSGSVDEHVAIDDVMMAAEIYRRIAVEMLT